MPSSEKVISPGVFTNEVDQSFLPAAIGDIGAAIVGPTAKGASMQPTVVSSYSEFQKKFGDTFKSGSATYTYLTSLAAREYLRYGNKLTVIRVLAGSPSAASANVLTGSGNYYTGSASPGDTEATANTSFKLHTLGDGVIMNNKDATSGDEVAATGTITVTEVTNLVDENTFAIIDTAGTTHTFTIETGDNLVADNKVGVLGAIATGGTAGNNAAATKIAAAINDASSTCAATITAVAVAAVVTLTQDVAGASGNGTITDTAASSDITVVNFTGGITDPVGTNNLLLSGSKDNVRWEISSLNNKKGTFSLLIRRGNDIIKRKQILESWPRVNLDPNSSEYIAKAIGDQYTSLGGSNTDTPYITFNGSYPNKSKYVRVEVIKQTTDYLDENGNVRVPAASASLPGIGSGSFGGSFSGGTDGTVATHPHTGFYESISESDTQGFNLSSGTDGETAYIDALKLLKNQDEFDINLILVPGVFGNTHSAIAQKVIDVCEDRGDCFAIIDPVGYDSTISATKTQAETRDSNYAAMYWPWVKIPNPELGKTVWVPPSVAIGGVYAFNDKVAHPWMAPAGLNRGALSNVGVIERNLTQADRDNLYDSNVNPIATFAGQGINVWGQKTLQKKISALDRVNVRRLLIKLKKFIASTSRFLVFEQNNSATRARFLNVVNPYLEQVQSNSGLTSFRVVMDDTNNTPDIVDRNILYGQIFVQPTRTAEFIVLDFTVQPTGATFPSF